MKPKYLTFEQTEEYLQHTLDALHAEAEANRKGFNLGKTFGLTSLVASGIACVALPAVGVITAVSSLGLYVGSLLSEAGTTGEFTPIPFCSTRMSSIAIGALQESTGLSDADLELSDYLPKRDRILYLLLLTQGERMAKVLSQLPTHRWKPTLEGEISKINRVLMHGGTRLDYLSATQQGAEMVDYVEKNLNLPVSREVPQVSAKEEPKELIGSNTRLNSIEVPSVETDDFWQTKEEIESVPVVSARVETVVKSTVQSKESINLAKLIVDNIYSYAIISPSGGGKGLLTSHIVRQLKTQRPDLHVFLCDPKDDPKESGYWENNVDTWYKTDFATLNERERTVWLKQMLEDYTALPSPKILILDETTAIFSHLKNSDRQLFGTFKAFISMVASSGNSRENYLMILGHSPNLGDYGISGGDFVNFNKVFIANGSKIQAIKQLGTTSFTGGQFGQDQVDNILSKCKQSPVNRAFYLGVTDKWYPMDNLENFSGYNRDTRSMVAG